MTKDDMIISHVFDTERLTIGKCYKFQCGNATEYMGVLTFISEDTLVFLLRILGRCMKAKCTPMRSTPRTFIMTKQLM